MYTEMTEAAIAADNMEPTAPDHSWVENRSSALLASNIIVNGDESVKTALENHQPERLEEVLKLAERQKALLPDAEAMNISLETFNEFFRSTAFTGIWVFRYQIRSGDAGIYAGTNESLLRKAQALESGKPLVWGPSDPFEGMLFKSIAEFQADDYQLSVWLDSGRKPEEFISFLLGAHIGRGDLMVSLDNVSKFKDTFEKASKIMAENKISYTPVKFAGFKSFPFYFNGNPKEIMKQAKLHGFFKNLEKKYGINWLPK